MSSSKAFRDAAESFNGNSFTKQQLKEKFIEIANDSRAGKNFGAYLCDYRKRPICGLQIIGEGKEGPFTIRITTNNKSSSPKKKSKKSTRPTICYPNAIPSYIKLDDFIRGNSFDHVGSIILLTNDNAVKVEHLIATDPKYLPNAKRLYTSLYSNASNPKSFVFNRSNIEQMIEQIDKDNSTFDVAISSKKGSRLARYSFCDYILNPANDFLRKLDAAIPTPVNKQLSELVDNLKKSHTSYSAKSLASKVCKYLHEYYYDNDKYYINDKVVRSMLPYYLNHYGVPHSLNTQKDRDVSYVVLYDYLEKLRETAKNKHGSYIKRSELDHILWYCYKMFKNKEL